VRDICLENGLSEEAYSEIAFHEWEIVRYVDGGQCHADLGVVVGRGNLLRARAMGSWEAANGYFEPLVFPTGDFPLREQ
jgi:hypothetical protein